MDLKELSSKAVDFEEVVDYSDGSVVSKTLIDEDEGTITLFAFDKGQTLSEHSAPFHAFVQVIDGKGTFIIDKEPVEAQEGQWVLMPADIPHAVEANERFKMVLVMIKNKT
jgi:quercetin dioxygenase-like cupin family protein